MIITTVSSAGAEIVPFLKIFGIIPGVFLVTFFYLKLCKFLKRNQIFYVMVGSFLGYFFIFSFVLYPNNEFFALSRLGTFLESVLPLGWKGFAMMVRYWHVSCFYVLCEIWSSAIMFVLFWGFMNETTSMAEATIAYPFYNISGNLAAFVAGYIVKLLLSTEIDFGLFSSQGQICDCFFLNIFLCMFMGIFAIFFFRYLSLSKSESSRIENKKALNDKKPKVKKEKYGFFKSFTLVLKSRYLFCLLVLVFAYNAVFIWHDTLWDQTVKDYFNSNPKDMLNCHAKVLMIKGVISTILALLTPILIRCCGWRKVALITPFVLFLSSLVFFPLVYLQGNLVVQGAFYEYLAVDLMFFLVWLGGVQNAFIRGSKYSLYDTTKEMVFIPLSTEEKRQSKVVVDGIASRLGKSSGSVILVVLLSVCSSLKETIPYLLVLSLVITIAWLYSVVVLDREVKQKQKSKCLSVS